MTRCLLARGQRQPAARRARRASPARRRRPGRSTPTGRGPRSPRVGGARAGAAASGSSRSTSGGGGYGDPLERDPELVLDDVLEGWVSPGAGGVRCTASSCAGAAEGELEIDEEATGRRPRARRPGMTAAPASIPRQRPGTHAARGAGPLGAHAPEAPALAQGDEELTTRELAAARRGAAQRRLGQAGVRLGAARRPRRREHASSGWSPSSPACGSAPVVVPLNTAAQPARARPPDRRCRPRLDPRRRRQLRPLLEATGRTSRRSLLERGAGSRRSVWRLPAAATTAARLRAGRRR